MIERRTAIVLLVLMLSAAVVYASVNTYTVTQQATYSSADGPEIVLGEDLESDAVQPFPDDNTIDMGPEVEFSSDDRTHVRVDEWPSQNGWTKLSEMDVQDAALAVDTGDQRVDVQGDATGLEFREVAVDDDAVDLRVAGDSGQSTVTIHGLDEGDHIKAIDDDTGDLVDLGSVSSDGTLELTVEHSETAIRLESSEGAPELSNEDPPDSTTITERQTGISVDVDDPDGLDVDVEITHNGETIAQETVEGSGTVSGDLDDLDAGEHTWTVTAEDELGQTTEETYSFGVPAELEIRDVLNQTLIDHAEVTVEFYGSDRIIERTTTDGTVDLTGLPADEKLYVSVEADGYHARTTIIPSLIEQQEAYLLPDEDGVDDVTIVFQLDDNTGQFDPGTTDLLIKRSIATDGDEREWKVVSGDGFGAANEIGTTLERDQRYRLIIESEDGDRRMLGEYTPTDSTVTTLEVGQIEWTIQGETYSWEAGYHDDTDPHEIEFGFSDPEERTTDLEIVVYEQGDEDNVLATDSVSGPIGTYQTTFDVPEDQEGKTWVVEWDADREDRELGGSRIVADELRLDENPMPDEWAAVLIGFILLFAGLLFGGVHGAIGAVFVSALSAVLMWLGWWDIGATVVLGALFVAVMFYIGDRP